MASLHDRISNLSCQGAETMILLSSWGSEWSICGQLLMGSIKSLSLLSLRYLCSTVFNSGIKVLTCSNDEQSSPLAACAVSICTLLYRCNLQVWNIVSSLTEGWLYFWQVLGYFTISSSSVDFDEDHLYPSWGWGILVLCVRRWLVRPIRAWKVLEQYGQILVAALGHLEVPFFLSFIRCSAVAILYASCFLAPLYTADRPVNGCCGQRSQSLACSLAYGSGKPKWVCDAATWAVRVSGGSRLTLSLNLMMATMMNDIAIGCRPSSIVAVTVA